LSGAGLPELEWQATSRNAEWLERFRAELASA
jgi:hypothetical protein